MSLQLYKHTVEFQWDLKTIIAKCRDRKRTGDDLVAEYDMAQILISVLIFDKLANYCPLEFEEIKEVLLNFPNELVPQAMNFKDFNTVKDAIQRGLNLLRHCMSLLDLYQLKQKLKQYTNNYTCIGYNADGSVIRFTRGKGELEWRRQHSVFEVVETTYHSIDRTWSDVYDERYGTY